MPLLLSADSEDTMSSDCEFSLCFDNYMFNIVNCYNLDCAMPVFPHLHLLHAHVQALVPPVPVVTLFFCLPWIFNFWRITIKH